MNQQPWRSPEVAAAIVIVFGSILLFFFGCIEKRSDERAAAQETTNAAQTAEIEKTNIAATKPTSTATVTASVTVPTSSPSPTVKPTEVFTPSPTPTQTPTPTPTLIPTPTGPEITMAFPQERMNVPRQLTACGTYKNVPKDKEMWFYVYAPVKEMYYLDKISDKSATDGTWIIRAHEGVNVGDVNSAGKAFYVGVVLASDEESPLWEEKKGEEKNTTKEIPKSLQIFYERIVYLDISDELATNFAQNCIDQVQTGSGSALGE